MAQDRRITKTKTAIREAYFSILKENSSAKITVTEIANRANIDRKTFYLHYDSPEALMEEFYKNLVNDFLLILEKNDFFVFFARTFCKKLQVKNTECCTLDFP